MTVQELIAQGSIVEALEFLYKKDDVFAALLGRWNSLERENGQGILSTEYYRREKSIITQSLTDTLRRDFKGWASLNTGVSKGTQATSAASIRPPYTYTVSVETLSEELNRLIKKIRFSHPGYKSEGIEVKDLVDTYADNRRRNELYDTGLNEWEEIVSKFNIFFHHVDKHIATQNAEYVAEIKQKLRELEESLTIKGLHNLTQMLQAFDESYKSLHERSVKIENHLGLVIMAQEVAEIVDNL